MKLDIGPVRSTYVAPTFGTDDTLPLDPTLKKRVNRPMIVGALIMGLAADVRQIGEVLFIPVAIFAALVARGGWRRAGYLAAGAVSCAIPMLVYMSVSQASGNGFTLAAHELNDSEQQWFPVDFLRRAS